MGAILDGLLLEMHVPPISLNLEQVVHIANDSNEIGSRQIGCMLGIAGRVSSVLHVERSKIRSREGIVKATSKLIVAACRQTWALDC